MPHIIIIILAHEYLSSNVYYLAALHETTPVTVIL